MRIDTETRVVCASHAQEVGGWLSITGSLTTAAELDESDDCDVGTPARNYHDEPFACNGIMLYVSVRQIRGDVRWQRGVQKTTPPSCSNVGAIKLHLREFVSLVLLCALATQYTVETFAYGCHTRLNQSNKIFSSVVDDKLRDSGAIFYGFSSGRFTC